MQSGFACARELTVSHGVLHLRPFNIGINGEIDLREVLNIPTDYRDNIAVYELQPGDVLFNNTNSVELVGKTAIVRSPLRCGFSNHLTRLRIRDKNRLDPAWLILCLRTLWIRGFFAQHCNRWIGQAGFNPTKLANLAIPIPPIDFQRRIAARIEALFAEVERARTLLDHMRRDVDVVLKSALAEVIQKLDRRSPESPTLQALLSNERLAITGGGTPSTGNKQYWNGAIPWVSPKDMKSWYIDDAQDHISPIALEETAVKLIPKRSVLVVVRGMILAHTFPVSVTTKEVTINQDMKALAPADDLLPEYLAYILRARAPSILRKVEIAAHGTRRLKTNTLMQVVVPDIPKDSQQRIVAYLDSVQSAVNDMQRILDQDAKLLDQLERSILERAFRGEL
jgi:restriction endonuclease S subunit